VISWAIDLFNEMEELITDVSRSPWFFLVVYVIALLDSVIPIVPSEFTVIAGGVAAGDGVLIDDRRSLSLVLLIVFGSAGAFTGDSLAYWIGRRSDAFARRWVFRGEKGEARLVATGEQIRKRGGMLLITARFIPGGRTAMTISCGLTKQPFLEWFARWDLLATTLWASYAAIIGFAFSNLVENQSTALWLAFGFALGITLLIEAARWTIERVKNNRVEGETAT
jgi:membrane-associated protein